ncbi:hypothetical protein [Echinicola sp. 20G]|uniref:hypothetical protein n=1 Tax=Echinicola sp. 20G TaxID=2781961 RepID=UPI00191038C4|nr:hypothetical protein [Echinicola sp. 20G]
MDILEILESGQSKDNTTKIVNYIGDDPDRFAELFILFRNGTYKVTQRASWPLGIAAEKCPGLLLPYYKDIVIMLKKANVHDAVKRNILRMLQDQDVPEVYEGEVLNAAFTFLEDKAQPIAIRVFAMQVVYNLSERYPEIRPELKLIIEDMLPYASAGIRSRGKKILSKLSKD